MDIEAGHIAGVWSGSAAGVPADGADVVDASGLTLLPGLIDGHVHLLLDPNVDGPDGWDQALLDDEALLLRRAGEAAARLLGAGVTTARDCGGPRALPLAIRDAIAAETLAGPRILASGRVITRSGGHGHRFGIAADDAAALRTAALELLGEGVDFLKVMATGGNLSRGSRPDLPQYSATELAVLTAEAHRAGRRVTAHAHSKAGIRNAVEAGIDSIEHCSWLGPDGRDYDPAIVGSIVTGGVFVDFTPAVAHRLIERPGVDGWSPLRDRLRRVREVRLPTMLPMWQAGVQFYFGSDAGTPLTLFEDFALVLERSVLAGGLAADVVIAAATGTAARALGIAGTTGTIAVGKVADLLLVEGNPLRDIRDLRRVRRVYRSGRLVVDNSQLRGATVDRAG